MDVQDLYCTIYIWQTALVLYLGFLLQIFSTKIFSSMRKHTINFGMGWILKGAWIWWTQKVETCTARDICPATLQKFQSCKDSYLHWQELILDYRIGSNDTIRSLWVLEEKDTLVNIKSVKRKLLSSPEVQKWWISNILEMCYLFEKKCTVHWSCQYIFKKIKVYACSGRMTCKDFKTFAYQGRTTTGSFNQDWKDNGRCHIFISLHSTARRFWSYIQDVQQ